MFNIGDYSNYDVYTHIGRFPLNNNHESIKYAGKTCSTNFKELYKNVLLVKIRNGKGSLSVS